MGKKKLPCIECETLCFGERCQKCYAKVMSVTRRGVGNPQYGKAPNENQLRGLRVGHNNWKRNFVVNGRLGGAGVATQLQNGHETWNKGIKGEDSHAFGFRHSEETKEKCREARMNQVMVTESRQEWMMQDALDRKGVEFETHKKIFGEPDIFIKPNYCVFVDGTYWHNYPEGTERDTLVNKTLEEQGYEVIRYWQSEIVEDIENVTIDLLIRIDRNQYNGRSKSSMPKLWIY